MKASYKKLMCLLMAVILLLSLCSCRTPGNSTYYFNLEYDGTKVNGSLRLVYVNKSSAPVNEVNFPLYANAFRVESTAPFSEKQLAAAYPNGFSPGGIEITSLSVNGRRADFCLSDDYMMLTAAIPRLSPGGSTEISMSFNITFPNASGRFGCIDRTVNMGNCLPIADNSGTFDGYTDFGDPFCSECADFNVCFTLPSGYTLASSGAVINKDESIPFKTVVSVTGNNIRDFGCVFGPEFKMVSAMCGNTAVYCYFRQQEEQAHVALESACEAIKLFGELFGEYPYTQFSVVETDFFIGGMEYPNMVMIDRSCFMPGAAHILENTVVHETAHQWWYSAVGNDQRVSAWIDEGLATYSTMLYYEHMKEPSVYKTYYNYYITNAYRFSRASLQSKGSVNEKINRPLFEFESAAEYQMLCYQKSAMLMQFLRESLGDGLFFSDLKNLYSNNLYGLITEDKFIAEFSRGTTLPVAEVINSWLEGKVHIG